ncbi:MAG: DUF1499 domain-containing protein [Cyanobacteriota bacterium]|nr:DUF1499 domain-containing protein [Cyanobacteriota bacterium]
MSTAETRSKLSLSRIFLIATAVVAIGWIAMRIALPNNPTLLSGSRPNTLGVRSGQLAPCPSTPNCVSSQSSDPEQYIDPFTYDGEPSEALSRLEQLVQKTERAQVIAKTDNYLYAEFTSRWMGFVDDVEFFLDNAGEIEVRSASRLGESDLGVNRQRVETLRGEFQALVQSGGS